MKNKFLAAGLLLCLIGQAQHPKISNIVFEGSGIRGIAYCGALQELENRNLLKNVQRVGGTSAGAVTALLVALGYTAGEITELVNSTPYRKFNDGKFFFIGGMNRMNKYYGWYRGQQFDKWLSKLIEVKTGNRNITFEQLHQKGFKELYVTGTCLNRQSLVLFSRETYPGMKVKDAVRISMSIPLYFEAVFIDASGDVVNHPRKKEGLDIMVDGGFLANFPIRMFDSTKYLDPSAPNQFAVNPQTIGFRIDRKEQIENDDRGQGLAPMPINTIRDYFGAFYTIVLENLNRQTLTKEDWDRTISISDERIAPRIRKLSAAEIGTLITNGATATKKYFSTLSGD